MTARFGRNKRRSARLAVEQAHAQAVHAREEAEALIALHRQRTRRAESILAEITERLLRAVGDDTALLPLSQQPRRRSPLEPWMRRYPVRRDVDGCIAMSAEIPTFSISIEDHEVFLHRLVLSVERDPNRFAKLIRFEDGGEHGDRGRFTTRAYWVSDHALKQIGLMGDDVTRLAEEIARGLVELPKRDGGPS